jgi:hypothetical protein
MLGLFLSGCVTTHHTKGSKVDESMLTRIEKGKTARSDILKWFGSPDRIIGAGITAETKTAMKGDIELAHKSQTSIGENQEIYIYEYFDTSGVGGLFLWYGTSSRERKNTLMIWIDKETGLVQDYGYKKEIE